MPNRPAPLTPLTLDVVTRLRSKLGQPPFSPGVYFPSETDLAEEFGVSRGTLRKAIDFLIDQGELIRSKSGRIVMKEAAGTPLGSIGSVYVWAFCAGSVRASDALSGLVEVVTDSGMGLEIVATPFAEAQRSEWHERRFLIRALDAKDCRAVAIWRDHKSAPTDIYRAFMQRGIPMVFIDKPPPPGVEADFVGIAHQASAFRAVTHAISLGHRQIVCVSHGLDTPFSVTQRVAGYRDAMEGSGLGHLAKVIVPHPRSPFTVQTGLENHRASSQGWYSEQIGIAENLYDQIASLKPRPSAVFSAFETSAYFLRLVAEKRGICIPEELSLIGYAIRRPPGDYVISEPSGTIIDYVEIGRQAGLTLVTRLNGEKTAAPHETLLVPPLYAGDTLAPISEALRTS